MARTWLPSRRMVRRLRPLTTVATVALCLSASACLEKCAPGQVGNGVARLTMRNVGAVVELVNADEVCGFEAAAVKDAFEVDAEPGKQGCATWKITGCDLDLGPAGDVAYSCDQTATITSGRIVVDATRIICGTVTGDRNQPVVPLGPDAVTVALDRVQFDDFAVEDSTGDTKLTWKLGSISAVAKPRLAASESQGICMIPTPNIELSDVRYEDALVHVVAEGRSFEVPVPSSDMIAVNGTHGERENFLGGRITVWGSDQEVGDDGDGLNPDYNASAFLESYACEEDLALPVNHECGDLGPVLAQGAARLTIRNLGTVSYLTEKNTDCGFSSPAVLDAIQITEGRIGGLGAAKFRVEACTIEVPADTVLKSNCAGEDTVVGGKIVVTAEKTMRGRLTGDLEQPVVPMDDAPVEFYFERVETTDFVVSEAGTGLTMKSGAITARVKPRTAMDTELGACGFETPVARMWDVRYLEATPAIVKAEQGRFETTIEASDLMAVNGSWGSDENLLDGTMSLGGETYSLPTNPADDGLDPEYDAATFASKWMCGAVDMRYPFECLFVRPLAQGASQLTAMTLGQVTNLLESDTTCGFSSDAVLDTVAITGPLGEPGGSATFAIDTPCELSFTTPTIVDEDCHGKKTYVEGTVRATGTKSLRGYVSGDRLQPIVPTTRDPARISLSLDFTNFRIWTDPGDNELKIYDGRLSGSLSPRTAIDTVTGACSLPTPVVRFESMVYSDANLQITSEGRAFDVHVSSSSLDAVNGARDGVENLIEGTIVVDGESVSIPINPGEGLDPEYDAARFVASFACEPNLELPTKEDDCNMMKPLGEGAARLLVSALGAATSIVNADNNCGYSKLGVMMDPDRVEGNPGQMGLMEWELNECVPEDYDADPDCLGYVTRPGGSFVHTGRRTVRGIREEISILFFSFDSIVPNSHNSVVVDHDVLVFDEFEAYDYGPDSELPSRGITIHSGTMSARVEPITGRNGDNGYDVPTKVARMSNVVMGPAPITILYEGKTFNVQIDGASLRAFNGSWVGAPGETNTIAGEISINGTRLVMPEQGLDPDFDQADFDARYACTDDLQETIPPAR